MKLKKVSYKEFSNNPDKNYWELSGLDLGNQTLIVGKNATGKTRVVNLIVGLSKVIQNPASNIKNGEWDVTFETVDGKELNYQLDLINGIAQKERVVVDKKIKLDRSPNLTKIFSATQNKDLIIEPPDDKLVLHIRRDKAEHPFLEELYEWANHTRGYRFGKYDPSLIAIPGDPKGLLENLETTPSILEKLSKTAVSEVIDDFNQLGYEVERVKLDTVKDAPLNIKFVYIQEKGIVHPILQMHISSGMFRAFALLVILRYLMEESNGALSTVLVDDLGEGLDYDRSTQLAKIVFEKMSKNNLQLIAATNDRFLMNAVDIKNWNILLREVNKAKAVNYSNNKKLFDEFKLTGLSNFDLFSSDFLTQNGKQSH